jgi:hypothetical protein
MAVLRNGKAIGPFWGASINIITGLDPLSLQTTSEATYATLLPGISNLTNRLRYYGFYCWLLDLYFNKEQKGNSTEQYKFIRRAELMIAILMQSEKNKVLQITGSSFAANLIANQSDEYYDLAAGADKNNSGKSVYWKYVSGAFGQYYYGPLKALSLVGSAENDKGDAIYKITQSNPSQKVSGKELSDAFGSNISSMIRDLFLKNLSEGKLFKNDIPELIKYLDIEKVYSNSTEWHLYAKMLLDRDEPGNEIEEQFTYHRKETILELIHEARENENKYDWRKFLLKAYNLKMGSETRTVSETLIGWYAYQFNEYYQYANGAIFWATLQELYNTQNDQYLPSFINLLAKGITEEICKKLSKTSKHCTVKEILSAINIEHTEETLYKAIETFSFSSTIAAAVNGFLLLFRLYNENLLFMHPLNKFMNRKSMIRDGNMIEGLISFEMAEEDNIETFIEQFLHRKIINRHQMVAIRKMGSGYQSTQKFIIEDQYIKFIDTFPPRLTSPRMNALLNLLNDLNVVGGDDILTPVCEMLIAN